VLKVDAGVVVVVECILFGDRRRSCAGCGGTFEGDVDIGMCVEVVVGLSEKTEGALAMCVTVEAELSASMGAVWGALGRTSTSLFVPAALPTSTVTD